MNYAQPVEIVDGHTVISYDWYPGFLPSNMEASDMVYFDTSYSFASFNSVRPRALQLGYATGNYNKGNIITGENGVIKVGKYVILDSTNLVCNEAITIGDHCMFSWGSVVTDSWLDASMYPASVRNMMLENVARSNTRYMEFERTRPVVIEDNVWVGFDAVILPGVTLGRGSVIGCKTIVTESIPPYAVVVGHPAKIVKYLEADDTAEAQQLALQNCSKKMNH